VDVMNLLLLNGADPGLQSKGGGTPLLAAAGSAYRVDVTTESEKVHLEALKLLIRFGAGLTETDHRGSTALHVATLAGYASVVQFLVEQGIPINARNKAGQTALAVADSTRPQSGTGDPFDSVPALLRRLGATK